MVRASQAHPDPNRVAPAFWNCSLNYSKDPNALSMAWARAPEGALAPPGAKISQNMLWL